MTPLPMTDETPEPERAERCETCRYRCSLLMLDDDGKWCSTDEKSGITEMEYEVNTDGASGECRRYPPVVFGAADSAYWPNVYLDEWCGEWSARPVTVEPRA